jgi:hypothetical protein
MPEAPKRKVIPSRDFRSVYANIFRLRLGDNDGAVTFMMETDDGDGVLYNQEQVQVVMTPRGMKTLHLILANALEQLEKIAGPIQIAPGLVENIQKTMKVQKPEKT